MTDKAKRQIESCRSWEDKGKVFFQREGKSLWGNEGMSLDLSNCKITDLSGIVDDLMYLTHLTSLSLDNNQVNSLESLSRLKSLSFLNLSNNQINDIKPLSQLVNLKYLYLTNNQISNIEPLSQLVNLLKLYINSNRIRDIKYLLPLLKHGMFMYNDFGVLLSSRTDSDRQIYVEDNLLNSDLITMIDRGNQVIIDYYDQIERREIKKKTVLNSATELIKKGKLDKTIDLLATYFKEEGDKELSFKVIMLSQQLNAVKEKFDYGLVEISYQRTEQARITQALLSLIWEAEV